MSFKPETLCSLPYKRYLGQKGVKGSTTRKIMQKIKKTYHIEE